AGGAPAGGPLVVGIGRNMGIRPFENPSVTYGAAAPEDVPMTDRSDAPMAYRIGTPKTRTSGGTITTPPPRPVRAPTKPAMRLPSQTRVVNGGVVTDVAS